MAQERCPRWTEAGSDAPPLLKELIKRERADAPSDAQLRELAERIAALGLSGAPEARCNASESGRYEASAHDVSTHGVSRRQTADDAEVHSGDVSANGVGSRVVIGTACVLLTGVALWAGGGWLSQRGKAELRLPEAVVASTRLVVGSAAPDTHAIAQVAPAVAAVVRAESTRDVAGPALAASPQRVLMDSGKSARTAARRSIVPPPTGSLDDELELLRTARKALSDSPERALGVVAKHEAAFRQGVFAEEREAITIEALLRTGKRAPAEQRARAFARSYPGSAYQRRITALLQNP